MSTGKNDAQPAKSGINEELLKEITAQYAILNSATKLINQQVHNTNNDKQSNKSSYGWVYNMKDLAHWIHHYTERRRLHCPHCKAETTFTCQTCNEVYEYHDEL